MAVTHIKIDNYPAHKTKQRNINVKELSTTLNIGSIGDVTIKKMKGGKLRIIFQVNQWADTKEGRTVYYAMTHGERIAVKLEGVSCYLKHTVQKMDSDKDTHHKHKAMTKKQLNIERKRKPNEIDYTICVENDMLRDRTQEWLKEDEAVTTQMAVQTGDDMATYYDMLCDDPWQHVNEHEAEYEHEQQIRQQLQLAADDDIYQAYDAEVPGYEYSYMDDYAEADAKYATWREQYEMDDLGYPIYDSTPCQLCGK
jgi:hypothetical protein